MQLADAAKGMTRRWRFVEIEADSFRWIGDVSTDGGKTWTPALEMHARRRIAPR